MPIEQDSAVDEHGLPLVHETHIAMYDFSTQDETKLAFVKDEVIRVYQKAENGWWFPSNYVQKLEEYAKTPNGEQSGALLIRCETEDGGIYYVHRFTGSTYFGGEGSSRESEAVVSDLSSIPSTPEKQFDPISYDSLPENWKRLQAPDGKVIFFNSDTKELQWTHPEMEATVENLRKVPVPFAIRRMAEELPMNWGRKSTQDRKLYYYNYKTDQTTWNLEDIDSQTGELTVPQVASEAISQRIQQLSDIKYPKGNSLDLWKTLTEEITKSIATLDWLAVHNQREKFIHQSAIVVENIRVVLLASLNPSGSTKHIEAQGSVKGHHRAIMTALSRLVLEAKAACGIWPPPDAITKLRTSGADILEAVRDFVEASITAGVTINAEELKKAKLSTHKQDTAAALTTSEIVARLQQFLVVISGRTTDIIDALKMIPFEKARDGVLGNIERILSLVGKFLSTVAEELAFETCSHEMLLEFGEFQFVLNSSIKELMDIVSVAQGLYSPPNIVQEIAMAVLNVKNSTSDLLLSCKFLIQEHENHEGKRIPKGREHIPNAPPTTPPPPLRRTSLESDGSNDFSTRRSLPAPRVTPPTLSNLMARRHANEAGSPAPSLTLNLSILGSNSKDSLASPRASQFAGSIARAARTFGIDAILSKRQSERRPSDSAKVEKPWYLKHDYSDKEVLYNPDSTMRGATLNALIEKLTVHDANDVSYVQSFLLTYHSFTTSERLLELLKERFCVVAPEGLSAEEFADWETHKRNFIQIRVLNVLKLWLESYFYETEEDHRVLAQVKEFSQNGMMAISPNLASQLQRFIERREEYGAKTIVQNQFNMKDIPPPILPKSLRNVSLLDLDATEVARQLTLLESQAYQKIQPVECLKKAWSRKDGSISSPNVKAMILLSNQVAGWIVQSILSENDLKNRANLVKHFISIAEKCRSLNNFCTLNTILGALASSSIYRLKRTWELIGKRSLERLETLKHLMTREKNFSRYRATLRMTNPPCVPYFGLFLTDLTFIEDGCTDLLKNPVEETELKFINFFKWSKTADVIRDIQQFQNEPYHLTGVKEIQELLMRGFETEMDDQACFVMSLQLEPREREDEQTSKALRESLKESGFIV
ncbi:UNVERIFIED_CONTAM: hypothetical protein HDU68_002807 [Siphonaria sp. JEL0065]|nr:hypothetical protein HDU68_002807 [Siphonaria sp. JEL0065]